VVVTKTPSGVRSRNSRVSVRHAVEAHISAKTLARETSASAPEGFSAAAAKEPAKSAPPATRANAHHVERSRHCLMAFLQA
jgi:hypothetical protein